MLFMSSMSLGIRKEMHSIRSYELFFSVTRGSMLHRCVDGPAAGVYISSRTRRRVVRHCLPCRLRTRGSSLALPWSVINDVEHACDGGRGGS